MSYPIQKAWRLILFGLLATLVPSASAPAQAADFMVYGEYRALDMGNPGEKPRKDYYVNIGSSNGVHEGTELDVVRKISTYDLLSERLYKELRFPIARLKVIHVEKSAAIARLEKVLPPETTPAIAYPCIMVGDKVQISQ